VSPALFAVRDAVSTATGIDRIREEHLIGIGFTPEEHMIEMIGIDLAHKERSIEMRGIGVGMTRITVATRGGGGDPALVNVAAVHVRLVLHLPFPLLLL
jgi:hypothetical protein